MSYFQFPRLYIAGTYAFNPCTSNNDVITPRIVDLVPPTEGAYTSDSNTVKTPYPEWSDEKLQAFMLQTYQQEGRGELLYGQWNPFGDMTYWLQDVKIVAAELEPNKLLTDDSIIGTKLEMSKAVMIDLNPEGFNSSQLFVDNYILRGTQEALGKKGTYISRKPTKAVTRWINPYRNLTFHGTANSSGEAGGLSASFFLGWEILREDLDESAWDLNDHVFATGNSMVMQAFIHELKTNPSAKGLQMRINKYLTYPLLSDADLKAEFDKGNLRDNPAYGKMIATLGVWYTDELSTIARSRYLNWGDKYEWKSGSSFFLGPAIAQTHAKDGKTLVSVDLASTFPEFDIHGEKFPIQANLCLHTDQGEAVVLGNIENSTANYESRGGMVDFVYDQEMNPSDFYLSIEGTDFVNPNVAKVFLKEDEYMFGSDQNCVYTDMYQILHPDEYSELKVKFKLWRRGLPNVSPVEITFDNWLTTPSGLRQPEPDGPENPFAYVDPNFLEAQSKTFVVSGDEFEIDFRGFTEGLNMPGVYTYRLTAPGGRQGDPKRFNIINEHLSNVRILPLDDHSTLPNEKLTWEYVYQAVFRYYYITLPAMNRHLDMKNPANWNNFAAAIYLLKRTDPALHEQYLYMPRTRDLSTGNRMLIVRWAQKVLENNGYVPSNLDVMPVNYRAVIEHLFSQINPAELAKQSH